jgi:hypothetical protein
MRMVKVICPCDLRLSLPHRRHMHVDRQQLIIGLKPLICKVSWLGILLYVSRSNSDSSLFVPKHSEIQSILARNFIKIYYYGTKQTHNSLLSIEEILWLPYLGLVIESNMVVTYTCKWCLSKLILEVISPTISARRGGTTKVADSQQEDFHSATFTHPGFEAGRGAGDEANELPGRTDEVFHDVQGRLRQHLRRPAQPSHADAMWQLFPHPQGEQPRRRAR